MKPAVMSFLNNSLLYRAARLLLGLLLPLLLGALLFVIALWILESKIELNYTIELFMSLVYVGFLAVGLQSIIYSLLMEFYVRNRITDDWVAIKMSALLGLLAGSSLLLLAWLIALTSMVSGPPLGGLTMLLPYGAFIGAVVGWALRALN